MRLLRLTLVSIVATLSVAMTASHAADASLPKAAVGKLERIVRETLADEGIPGLSVAVRSAAGNWFAGFGEADREAHVRARLRDRYGEGPAAGFPVITPGQARRRAQGNSSHGKSSGASLIALASVH